MEQSPLWNYSSEYEPEMIQNLLNERNKQGKTYKEKHKITSQQLMKKEVEIMTTIINKLNNQDIFVGYVYDALICAPEHATIVSRVMNETILEFGVYTATFDVHAEQAVESTVAPLESVSNSIECQDTRIDLTPFKIELKAIHEFTQKISNLNLKDFNRPQLESLKNKVTFNKSRMATMHLRFKSDTALKVIKYCNYILAEKARKIDGLFFKTREHKEKEFSLCPLNI